MLKCCIMHDHANIPASSAGTVVRCCMVGQEILCSAYSLIAKDLLHCHTWENIIIFIRSTYTVACNSLNMNNVSRTWPLESSRDHLRLLWFQGAPLIWSPLVTQVEVMALREHSLHKSCIKHAKSHITPGWNGSVKAADEWGLRWAWWNTTTGFKCDRERNKGEIHQPVVGEKGWELDGLQVIGLIFSPVLCSPMHKELQGEGPLKGLQGYSEAIKPVTHCKDSRMWQVAIISVKCCIDSTKWGICLVNRTWILFVCWLAGWMNGKAGF